MLVGGDLNGSFISGLASETNINRMDTKTKIRRRLTTQKKQFLGSAYGSSHIIDDASS